MIYKLLSEDHSCGQEASKWAMRGVESACPGSVAQARCSALCPAIWCEAARVKRGVQ